MPYGDPMLSWYQDYCARLRQQGKSPKVLPLCPARLARLVPTTPFATPWPTTRSPTQARPVAQSRPCLSDLEGRVFETHDGQHLLFKYSRDTHLHASPLGSHE